MAFNFMNIFKKPSSRTVDRWKELGTYNSTFSTFGNDSYRSDIVRYCIRSLAEFSSKAVASCTDENLEWLLNNRPNMYMNGADFIYKIRTRLELLNTAFIYIQRDSRTKVVGLYPVPYDYFEALEYGNGLFIKFHFANGQTSVLPWEDLAVMRKDYNKSDIAGDDNTPIIRTLEMINTLDEGLSNSIKATANLRGILRSTKAMLAPEAVKEAKEEFVKDYMGLENSGGIAALDSTYEFTPINMSPSTASYEQRKEEREEIYRYYGVNEKIIMGDINTEELENWFKIRISPFLSTLSRELTSKIYPKQSNQKTINYTAEKGQFMTMNQKVELFNKVVLYGGMLIDEWRALNGMGHIEGGDKPVRRLDSAPIDSSKFEEDDDGKKGENDE